MVIQCLWLLALGGLVGTVVYHEYCVARYIGTHAAAYRDANNGTNPSPLDVSIDGDLSIPLQRALVVCTVMALVPLFALEATFWIRRKIYARHLSLAFCDRLHTNNNNNGGGGSGGDGGETNDYGIPLVDCYRLREKTNNFLPALGIGRSVGRAGFSALTDETVSDESIESFERLNDRRVDESTFIYLRRYSRRFRRLSLAIVLFNVGYGVTVLGLSGAYWPSSMCTIPLVCAVVANALLLAVYSAIGYVMLAQQNTCVACLWLRCGSVRSVSFLVGVLTLVAALGVFIVLIWRNIVTL